MRQYCPRHLICKFSAMRTPFDPLHFLTFELDLDLNLDSQGNIVCDDVWRLTAEKQKQARNVLRIYDRLLRLQLDAPSEKMRPSVRKLLAQGKIEIRNGQFVLPESHELHL